MMLPVGIVSFIISLALSAAVINTAMPKASFSEQQENPDVEVTTLSPLAEKINPSASIAAVLAAEISEPSPSPTSDPTLNPTSKPTSKPISTPTPHATIRPTPSSTNTTKFMPLPTFSPSPNPTPPSTAQLDEWFTKYANKESVNKDMLKKIAICESKMNFDAVNGDYLGMFQFSRNTWISTRKSMNQSTDPSLRTNPEETIKTAAFRFATQGYAAWPNCSK